MRFLLVERTFPLLGELGEKLEDLSGETLRDLNPEIVVSKPEDAPAKALGVEAVLIGPGLGDDAPGLVHSIRTSSPAVSIIVFHSDLTPALARLKPVEEEFLLYLFPDTAGPRDLELALCSIRTRSASPHLFTPRTLIAGRYEIVRQLGAGSYGITYLCRHRELSGHLVVIKILFPEIAKDKRASAKIQE